MRRLAEPALTLFRVQRPVGRVQQRLRSRHGLNDVVITTAVAIEITAAVVAVRAADDWVVVGVVAECAAQKVASGHAVLLQDRNVWSAALHVDADARRVVHRLVA